MQASWSARRLLGERRRPMPPLAAPLRRSFVVTPLVHMGLGYDDLLLPALVHAGFETRDLVLVARTDANLAWVKRNAPAATVVRLPYKDAREANVVSGLTPHAALLRACDGVGLDVVDMLVSERARPAPSGRHRDELPQPRRRADRGGGGRPRAGARAGRVHRDLRAAHRRAGRAPRRARRVAALDPAAGGALRAADHAAGRDALGAHGPGRLRGRGRRGVPVGLVEGAGPPGGLRAQHEGRDAARDRPAGHRPGARARGRPRPQPAAAAGLGLPQAALAQPGQGAAEPAHLQQPHLGRPASAVRLHAAARAAGVQRRRDGPRLARPDVHRPAARGCVAAVGDRARGQGARALHVAA